MTEKKEELFNFPCDFPIKVMGKSSPDFDRLVVEIIRRHCGDITEGAVSSRTSKGGNYLSVTVNIQAQSREQLDNLYQELSGHEQVTMVL
ncbi:HP0495 family protein [Candidatus Venteria ishoeyi]|uniref:UPF0250 protein MBHS_03127 n=2 Tax=Candidatus Venteria ishoeyi TaxID=1899563 RepID=A0A1H6FAY4_9GAMM|nr:DUF493 domain-containing protein [Candidatus Venteria ishoeyi]SEH07252.1 Uncharacterised protein [Candidatus Venteria ishoeyi]